MATAHSPNYIGNVPPLYLGQTDAPIPPGTIVGQILYWDGFQWVTLDPGIDKQQLTTHGDGFAPTWESPEAVLGEYWPPDIARLSTVAGFASAGASIRGPNRLMIDFPDSADRNCTFAAVTGDAYGGGSLQVDIDWVAASAVAGDVVWGVRWERMAAGGLDLDASGFAAAQFVTDPTEATNGVITRSQIVFTQAQADGIVAGDSFRLLLYRNGTDGNDDMVGDAQLVRIAVREL
jgi:hypothetical protein